MSRGTGTNDRANGLANGGPNEPPPSTLAAALISNLSTNKPSRRVEQDDLQRLMSEVSSMENNVDTLEGETKLEHQHKLIYVFARAVLERLTRDDPFLNVQQLVLQASEALDVFMSTIKATPEILDYVLQPGSTLQSRGQEPLWIWLFPRILTLLTKRHCDTLTEKIKAFFYLSFQAVSRSPKLWNLTSSFFAYFKECASAILHHLESPSTVIHGSTIEIVLPSGNTEHYIFSQEKDGGPNHFLHCTYALQDAGDALWHATKLLSMLVDISMATAASHNATPAFQDYVAWMLDSFLSVHQLQRRWQVNSSLNQYGNRPILLSFCAVQALLSSLEDSLPGVMVRKGYTFISIVCADILKDPHELLERTTRIAFCSSLLNLIAICKKQESVLQEISVHLLPLFRTISEDTASFENQHRDIQQTSIIFCKALQNEEVTLSHNFEDTELSSEFRRLKLDATQEEVAENGRPSKRRKLSVEPDLVGEVTTNLYMLLGAQKTTDLAGLHQIVEACFAELGNEDRCKAIEYLGQIPCAASSSLTVLRDPSGRIHKSKCSVCDEGAAVPASDLIVIREALYILSKLVKMPAFLDSRRPRVLAMITLRRFLAHSKDPELVDLEISPLGQWCLQSLQSSLRELRIAAGRTLQALLSCNTSNEIYRRNRVNVFAILRSLWEKENSKTYLQESCILAWGQIGRISKGQELNMVLLQLVEYLGNSNPIISGVAYTEILKLSKAIDVPTERMFGEFWANIAIIAVRDLLVRPQTSQFMADLLEMTVPDFLKLTQAYTLPYLVQTKKVDVIKKIAQARKDSESWQPCMEPLNLTRILAFLLVQNVPETESYILSLYKAISPRFNDFDLTDLLSTEPSSTAVQLLKAAGEADDSKKSRIRVALQMLASRVRLPSSDGHYSKKNSLGLFLEHHILGIVARFSDVVNDPREEYPFSEKLSSVRAIDEMVKIGKAYTRTARPQICACLQSAMAQKDLQASAFLAWQTMLRNLEDSDVEMMLESTFSTIIQRWDSFDNITQQRAQETLQYLLKERRSSVEVMISCLPSLSRFPLLAEIDKRLEQLRGTIDTAQAFHAFARRVSHENSGVVLQALVELKAYLQLHQSFLQASAVSEQPHAVVGQLVRAILDSCVRFNGSHQDIAQLAAECIGLIGSLDSNRVECIREQREIVVVSNFSDPGETTDFVLFLLEEVMVKAFLSATDTGLQGFLSFVMQDLLEKCDFRDVCGSVLRGSIASEENEIYQKWLQLPLSVQQTLTPFLTSKYAVTEMAKVETKYPIFRPNNFRSDRIYNSWLKTFVLGLLQKPANANTALIFPPLCRAIRIKDLSVASFLLPYVVLHVIIQGTDQQMQEIGGELLAILEYQSTSDSHIKKEELKMCSEAVFRILDYLSRWIQAKQAHAKRSRDVEAAAIEISQVTQLLEMIPAEVISRRSVECKSYARALFHWEQYIRDVRRSKTSSEQTTMLLERLQDIYTQIDEPDGIEGISAHLHVLDIDQQILGHRKAGRWTAAQSWYEIKLAEDPNDADVQVNLLTCLKESGQHDVLLNYVEGMHTATQTVSRVLPFATEASWATGRWQALERFVSMAPVTGEDFNVSIGQALLALHKKDTDNFTSTIKTLREHIACSLSQSTTSSIASCHDTMLKFHVLTELEMIAGTGTTTPIERAQVLASLDRRLEVVGAYLNDKQYLLGIRRAAMQLSSLNFTKGDVASAWLTSARLARKGNATHQSFNAVLHASQLGDESATIEHARLLWKEGQSRKAIQSLQGAIDSNAFISHNRDNSLTSFTGVDQAEQQNLLTARAHLLLAKWLDSAGQTQSNALRTQYQLAAKTHLTWEKGHYYLGRHYNKLLKTEKSLPPELQGEPFMIGETAKLVIENYLRSLSFGTKYIYQTLPRILTLWLDLGAQVGQPVDAKYGNSKDFVARVTKGRQEQLAHIHSRFPKYISKIPAYMFYTALPQIISRINHSNPEVFKYLQLIILKVVAAFPQHALWGLLAVATSMQSDRKQRGGTIIQQLRANARKADPGSYDMKQMISMGEKLAHELLLVCNAGDFPGNKTAWAKITTDLGFRPKICMPSPLAVPFEKVLTATLPTLTDNIKTHKAFSQDVVTIQSFKDDVMILSSLQKPRKLTARGSDGQSYGLMCKPKDDLRKDQRLMEFNSMINRALKRDSESSRRQLYIKTYAVTPLNEECGIIEWVDGLKTLRDILFALYRPLGISPNYREIEAFCEEACKSEDKLIFFSEKVLSNFPPIFHQWFVQQFPEPPAWFAARLRYTRSCAVMSMVGTILGLGDRHGENILFEEGNGGTFHVDFNCLFDKGLTFVKPERVPFRLTHNMVDAMGIYGYEGPFRKSSELTLKLLRQHEETLMTILEAFVYDPTLDLLTKKPEKKKKEGAIIIPTTAQGVLDTIQRKLRGLLAGESVPLGVEGQVDELIKQATNLHFLAGMYIGWCSFF